MSEKYSSIDVVNTSMDGTVYEIKILYEGEKEQPDIYTLKPSQSKGIDWLEVNDYVVIRPLYNERSRIW